MSPVNTYMLSSFGMFSGYFIFCLATEVVSSAVAAVCVCFADRPHVLEVNKCAVLSCFMMAKKPIINVVYHDYF